MDKIPPSFQDLLKAEKRAFAYLATVMEDGSPQVTPVWFDMDGVHILINSEEGRIKDKNMRSRPKIALAIADPDNPYRYIQVRGKVVEITKVGGAEHIDRLSYKYTGNPIYEAKNPKKSRVTYKIMPEKVSVMG